MTKLTKPVIRATGVFFRGDEVVVELHPKGVIQLRLKGQRSALQVFITADELYDRLAMQAAQHVARMAAIEAAAARRAKWK